MLIEFWAPLIALLGVLIGGLLTGLFSILNSYFQAVALDEREKNKLILVKLEELFDTIELVRSSYKNTFFTFHRYLIRTEKVPEAAPSDDSDPKIKILALVSFYAPTLKSKLEQLLQAVSEFSAFEKEVLLFLKDNRSGQSEIDRITNMGKNSMSKINESCLDMQKDIATLSKEYL